MKGIKGIFTFIAITCVICMVGADTQVWRSKVNSEGAPTQAIKLNIGDKYQVKVSGKMNLGKWRTGGHPLENDACFEFFADPINQKKLPKK